MIAIILRHHLLTALQSIFELSVFLLKELLQEARPNIVLHQANMLD